ncbi:hypothetical protein WT14_22150 [Burkholderia stagnalis]|nr:hypothetical protein WT05_32915 [Burkholderia stagnalis]KVN02564.1 hypothetical protein WT07_12910 [Burkholderia stagnalis]KVN59076.1 hypothetical protein WT14_22150 [Burkholderia stagnalis]KWE06671.1 hypothetical protein WT48_27680 [Burkholderia stagnalis]KWE11429.1 hypothetical protein WT47_06775 [Burkholderia stagnalis]
MYVVEEVLDINADNAFCFAMQSSAGNVVLLDFVAIIRFLVWDGAEKVIGPKDYIGSREYSSIDSTLNSSDSIVWFIDDTH